MTIRTRTVPTTGMRGGLGRTLLTAFLVLAIVPLSLIGYMAYNQVHSERQRDTLDRLATAVDLEEAYLHDWLSARQAGLDDAAQQVHWSSGLISNEETALRDTATRLRDVQIKDPAFDQVYLVVEAGSERWIAATGQPVAPPVGIASPQGAGPQWRLAQADGPTFELAAPLRDAGNNADTFIVGVARFKSNGLPINALGLGNASVIYLVNRDNQSFALQGVRAAGSAPSVGAARALAGQSGTAAYKDADGVPVIGVYRWLDDLQSALVAEQSQAEAFARTDNLAAGLIGAVLGVALLTTIIAAAVTRQITRPIVLLTEAALKMSGGDLGVRVQPVRRDEIGILAGVFNTMAAELAGLYAGLEQKVAERTRELQAAKEQIQYHAWQLSISAEVGRITTSILNLEKLLSTASELIRDAFQLDRVGVYLLDRPNEIAFLFNNVGRAALAHERQLRLGSDHPVSQAIAQRTPRLVTWRTGEQPSGITAELVIPLTLGTQAIGALHLTTHDSSGFVESDQSVLQTLAGQLSVAIENARTYSQEHEAADEMREIDRLRGQFLTRMSHQLATYLNTILGFSKLMLKGMDGPLNDTQTKDLTAIRQSGLQLQRLLDDTLELANLEVGAIELRHLSVEVNELLAELQDHLAAALVNPQLRLDMQVEPNLPIIMGDADRLRQVFTNLVMTASEICREGAITVHAARQVNQVAFAVAAPAPAADLEGNHAISLALSRRLIDLHGGQLRVEQCGDSTTIFGFSLPVNTAAAPTAQAAGR
jgi:signal transduction histidine kinase/HAMP domain-containing protein